MEPEDFDNTVDLISLRLEELIKSVGYPTSDQQRGYLMALEDVRKYLIENL